MIEIGLKSSILKEVLSGKKTIEGRLGTPKFLKIRAADEISLREDIWKDGAIVDSKPDRVVIRVKQVLYFETFAEMFSTLDFSQAIPSASSSGEAVSAYRTFYSDDDEYEYGVVAILFELK